MLLGVGDGHPGRPVVEQDPPGASGQGGQQRPHQCVLRITADRRGQLPGQTRGDGEELALVVVLHDEGGRSEDLLPQPGVGQKRRRGRAQQGRRRGVGGVIGGGHPPGSNLDAVTPGQRVQRRGIPQADPLVQQRGPADLRNPLADEVDDSRSARNDQQPRLRAELSCPQGHRGHEAIGDVHRAALRCAAGHEGGVHAAELTVERDGHRPGDGEVEQCAAAADRAGERAGSDARVTNQRPAGLDPLGHGEHTGRGARRPTARRPRARPSPRTAGGGRGGRRARRDSRRPARTPCRPRRR